MRVAIIGAGVTGLVAAYRLSRAGHECDVYERWPGLGGQAATLDVGDGHLLERYYHHLFTTDRHIAALYEELGMPDGIEWLPSSVATFAGGRSHPFTSPLDLLRFTPLSLQSRVRMGAAILWLQKVHRRVDPFEDVTAREWIERYMGREVWTTLWGPLLTAKFGSRADHVSMAWLWRKLTLRREIKGKQTRKEFLGYPRGSWEPLFERLRDEITRSRGRVLIDRPVARLGRDEKGLVVRAGREQSFRRGLDPRAFDVEGAAEHYDGVIVTVPSDIFEALLEPELAAMISDEYLGRVRGVQYQTALCLLLEIDRPFSPYYWTNIADPDLPFIGLVEHTNLVGTGPYGGRRFLYVSNYLDDGDPMQALDPDELIAQYEPGLRRVNPAFSRDWIRQRWLFREPAAQPVVTTGYQRRIPPLATGVPGLVLANTTQIYPEDRGTNYSVRLGGEAAAELAESVAAATARAAAELASAA